MRCKIDGQKNRKTDTPKQLGTDKASRGTIHTYFGTDNFQIAAKSRVFFVVCVLVVFLYSLSFSAVCSLHPSHKGGEGREIVSLCVSSFIRDAIVVIGNPPYIKQSITLRSNHTSWTLPPSQNKRSNHIYIKHPVLDETHDRVFTGSWNTNTHTHTRRRKR